MVFQSQKIYIICPSYRTTILGSSEANVISWFEDCSCKSIANIDFPLHTLYKMESFALLDYPDVSMETKGSMTSGRLKLTDKELQFKPLGKSGKLETVIKEDIELVNWQRLAGSWGIRIFTNEGKLHRFAGFKEAEREKLAKFFTQNYGKEMLDRELSVKGWNWGAVNFNGSSLSFEVGKSDAFEIPLPAVQQCTSGKNEVALEFHTNDESAVSLSEIRFHIPTNEAVSDQDPVEAFKDAVLKKAAVMSTSGDAIAILREVSALSPRGRFSIKIFPNYVHLHGKSFDYKIPSTSMVRLFLLPHKDSRQMHVAVNVDPPMKQGQTRYHYLVLIFKEEDELEIELPFTEEEVQDKYNGKLKKDMSGKTYEVITDLFKAITNRKLTMPGTFLGHSGTPAITCSYRAASGFMYPLERGLIYIYKPPIYLRYDEMQRVEFERTGGTSRSFDIKVNTIHDITYTFSSIEKGEYSRLYDYLKSKQIKVTTSGKMDGGSLQWDDKEKEIDHHLEKVKQDAELFSSGSDDMSSDDTDFKPDDLEALSAKEEYDSEPSTTSSEEGSDDFGSGPEADRKRAEKKKQKAERKAEKARKENKTSEPSEKKVKKKKMTKLPGQPKKNQSGYFLWMNENREKIKKEHSGLSMTELTKKAGEIWRDMKDKSKWNAKAEEDKKRYEKEMQKWKSEGGDEAIKAAKKQAKKEKRAEEAKSKTENKPKPSSSTKLSSVGTGSHFKSKEYIESSDGSSN